MLFDKEEKPNIGFTKEDIPLAEADNIIKFIGETLVDFKPSEPLKKETRLTQTLVRLLVSKKHPIWIFDKENIYSDSSSSEDIAVSLESNLEDAFFVIEAKRLDSTFPKSRKKEYIIGSKGGIERFKRDKHGRGLTHAGMIGYVQTDDFDSWMSKINSWIDEEIKTLTSSELTWIVDDKLIEQNKTLKTAKYTSIHNRISKIKINLTHLWIKLN